MYFFLRMILCMERHIEEHVQATHVWYMKICMEEVYAVFDICLYA